MFVWALLWSTSILAGMIIRHFDAFTLELTGYVGFYPAIVLAIAFVAGVIMLSVQVARVSGDAPFGERVTRVVYRTRYWLM